MKKNDFILFHVLGHFGIFVSLTYKNKTLILYASVKYYNNLPLTCKNTLNCNMDIAKLCTFAA